VTERLGDAEGILPYLYRRDWRPVPDLIRVGQNFQMAHRLVAASAAIGDTGPVARACGIVDFCLDTARHPAGGFCFAVAAGGRTFPATGPGSDLRQWWVQIEAVHALHVLARHPFVTDASRARYRRTRDEQWAFVRDRYFDEKFGGLRESVDEPRLRWHRRLRHAVRQALRPRPQLKTHGWKDPFHEVSAFIALGHPYAAASTAHSPQPAPVPLPAP